MKKHKFRSKFESSIAKQLEELGVKYEYEEVELRYDSKVHNGRCASCGSSAVSSTRSYLTDFYLPELDVYIEVKGRFTSTDRTKMRLVIEQTGLDIRMLFMQNNKLRKGSKTTYAEWCDKKSINYAFKNIPKEWVV